MIVLTVAFLAAGIAALLLRVRARARRRNAQTWDQLVARLEPEWNAQQLGDCLAQQDCTPEERWESFHGARGLWVMFQNARVMLEMADYALRHGSSIDRETLAQLRSDALQIRVSVIMALTQYALHQLNDRICANAQHAASMYSEMTARMGGLLDVSGGQFAPAFSGVR